MAVKKIEKIENVSDIEVGEVYLIKHKFNSKCIKFVPVTFDSVEVTLTSNNYTVLNATPVYNKLIKTGPYYVYVRKDGKLDKNTVKPLGNWAKNELKKKIAEVELIKEEINNLEMLIEM